MTDIIRCLIVDDDETKAKRIAGVVAAELGDEGTDVRFATCVYDAAVLLRESYFDLVIVDIQLPVRADEPPKADGGVRLLKQISRGTAGIRVPLSLLGMTAFEELAEQALKEFLQHGWAMLSYAIESTNWEDVIVQKCQHVLQIKSQLAKPSSHVDACILTALSDTELDAVMRLPWTHSTVGSNGEWGRMEVGTLRVGARELNLIACSCFEVGNAASAMTATAILERFRPRLLIMTGVCAGIDAEIGDLVVASQSLHYESGKWSGTEDSTVFHMEPKYRDASPAILDAIRRYKLNKRAEIMAIPADWMGPRPPREPSVHIGPVASGAAVIEHAGIVQNLQFRDRKLVGLEMESYGLYLAANASPSRYTEVIMIKGVMDRARPPKGDNYKDYAAWLSAKFVFGFLHDEVNTPKGLFAAGDGGQ